MVKLLSILSIVLAIVLFPPATLAVLSNNAVPGDATYPIKRVLEDGIFAVASLNPVTKAWFAAARSDRRYKEITVLLTQGKGASDTLNELVEQTQIAADQISQVSSESQKQQLAEQLSKSIEKYDQGLEDLSPQQIAQVPSQSDFSQEESIPINNSEETSILQSPDEISLQTPLPAVTEKPIAALPKQPIPAAPTMQPTAQPTLKPTALPTVRPVSTPSPNNHGEKDREKQKSIEEARKRLDEIRRKLSSPSSQLEQKPNDKQDQEKDKREFNQGETNLIQEEDRNGKGKNSSQR